MARQHQASVFAQAASGALRGLSHADQAGEIAVEASSVGPVERHRRLRVGPGAVKQQRQPMMKQVGERGQAGVLMMIKPLARMLGHMHRQRTVGAEQAEAQNRNVMQRAAFPDANRRQR